ncbi:MAG: hypothetical protein EWM45_13080 [Rhodopseudomonas palustris]|nr:MAG: hypothetical protein EWM45_13080 [Rhodopseudomonas palustris]
MSVSIGIRSYLDAASSTERDSLEEHSSLVDVIERMDGLFRRLVAGRWRSDAHPICGFLGMNAHANFLAASTAAFRGQSPATFMLLRGSLESALYAFLISLCRDDGEAWMARAQDPVRAKALFSANRGIQKLKLRDQNLAAMAKETYEWMIDFGGHPNPRSIVDHVRVAEQESNGDVSMSLIYINSAESLAVVRAIAACIENGCMVLAILAHTFPEHDDSADVFSQAWEIFREFEQYAIEDGYLSSDWSQSSSTE